MNKLDYCYHTHTYRCGHASGEDEDYVKSAIKIGIKRFGFSDHAMLPGIKQVHSRGDYSLLDDYLASTHHLKEKYKDTIAIKVGLEAEYSERFIDYYKDLLSSKAIDFLILGQHFNFDKSDNPKYIKNFRDDIEELYSYADYLIRGMRSGLFKYVAHPDLFVTMFKKWNKDCEIVSKMICEEAVKNHIPLEINIHAKKYWKDGYERLIYPCEEFWKIAGEYQVEVVAGYDAHHPSEFDNDIDFVFELIEKYQLNHLEDYTI
ncbi:MAG TPA: histidinol-phosphatase [Erysipelotrichaceae bacterium]|nr:histidinol-phosphatase [Erysipelotrichaceae bacterium]